MDEVTMEPIEEEVLPVDPNMPLTVVDVMFRSGGKVYFFDPGELEIAADQHVIIDTARGVEFGTCMAGNHTVRAAEIVMPLRPVLRIATAADERMAEENRSKEKDAFNICLQKIAEQGLDMQLVSAEYAFDGSKILFFFTADGRVDFRELVKSLAAVFRTRIELRQIGVRDKAKMVGGLGICGRPFCCSQFLEDFQPVSIKMAKVQNLSLNPTKISGTCGRLMCCLKYEQEAYEDLIRTSPRNESFVDTPDGRGTIMEVNLLRQSVKVRMEEHPDEIHSYANSEICVLRSGKAHKTDAPIPKEVAPISGNIEKKPARLQSTASRGAKEAAEAPANADAEPARKKPEQKESAVNPEQTQKPNEKQADSQPRHRNKGKGARPEGEKKAAEPQEAEEAAQKSAAKKNSQHSGKPHHKSRPEGEKQPHKNNRPEGENQQRKNNRPEGENQQRKSNRPEGEKQQHKNPRPEGENQQRKSNRPEGEKQQRSNNPRPEGEKQQRNPAEGEKPQQEAKSGGNRNYYHRRRKPSAPKQS